MRFAKYYQISKQASRVVGSHPGLIKISKLARNSKNILDVGCGEGTRLSLFTGKNKSGTGVEINPYALRQAKKQYSHLHFVLSKDEKLPLPSNSFDLVYSTFVLEHTQDQELFVKEMLRVTKEKGMLVILCPNYGAPNRRSPVSVANPVKKLIFGYIYDFFPYPSKTLFTKVTPKKVFTNPDDDTTCEPYLLKLIRHLKQLSELEVVSSSSLWEIDDNAFSIHQKIFKFLGQKGIFPFKFWGPQLFIILKKLNY